MSFAHLGWDKKFGFLVGWDKSFALRVELEFGSYVGWDKSFTFFSRVGLEFCTCRMGQEFSSCVGLVKGFALA